MRFTRTFRLVAALVALIGVLFTQLAVAAYVCPAGQISQTLEAVAAAQAVHDHRNMSGCDEAAMGQPTLCKAQTQVGNQSLDKPPLPDVSPFLAAVLVASVVHDNHDAPYSSPQTAGVLLTRTTAPPLAIQNCCFRI